LGSDRVVRLEVTLESLEIGRSEMLVEGSLAREFLIEHELARILRVKMEFVNETPGFLASGSDERMQLPPELLFVTRRRLKVNVNDDRSFSH
jgi:hypothetical protein